MAGKLEVNIDTSQIKNTLLNFIVPLISLGISAVLFLLILYPSINNIPSLETEKQSKSGLKNNLNQKLENLNRLVDFKSVVDENSELVDKVLRTEDDVPQLLNQVDAIARNSGLEVSKLSYSIGDSGEDGAEGGYESIFIALGAEGSYGQLIAFLKSVEDAARFVQVTKIRYSDSSSKDTSGIYSMNYSINSPYLFVSSKAETDEPVDLDITSSEFIDLINKLKGLTYYDYLENLEIPVIAEEKEEGELEETEETPEETPLEPAPETAPEAVPEPAPETTPETPAETPATENPGGGL